MSLNICDLVLIKVYDQLNLYCSQLPSQKEGLLSEEQLVKICGILSDIVTPRDNEKMVILAKMIGKKPEISRIVHEAIFKEEKYEILDHALTNEILNDLQEIVVNKVEDDEDRKAAFQHKKKVSQWLHNHSAHFFNGVNQLSRLHSLRLTALLGQITPNADDSQGIYPHLDKDLKEMLSSDSFKEVSQQLKNSSKYCDDYLYILAQYISCRKLPLIDLLEDLSLDELQKMSPYLWYGDFRGIENDDLIISLLEQGNNLNYVFIKSNTISRLPNLLACKQLNCSDCLQLAELPELPVCEDLDCSYCLSLCALPKLLACKKLNCSDCSELSELPELLVCEDLDCSYCSKLGALPNLLVCKKLNCSDCLGLAQLPELPVCEELICRFLKITTLPKLPNCLRLACDKCKPLVELPELPLCKKLSCGGCLFTALPELPVCEDLDCNECPNLTALPKLLVCKKLNCGDCPGLDQLPELLACEGLTCYSCLGLSFLPELSLCEALDCSGCLFTALPELPRCKMLHCNDSPNLAVLPRRLPVCQSLHCQRCPSLRDLPEVPEGCGVYSGQGHRMDVHVEELFSNPQDLLLKLGREHLLQGKRLPDITYYQEGKPSKAIDAGGVQRDLLTRLLQSLFKKEEEKGFLTISLTGWPEIHSENENDIDSYCTLGWIFALCYEKLSPFKLGPVFPEAAFKAIAALKPPNPSTNEQGPSSDDWIASFLLFVNASENMLTAFKTNDFSRLNEEDLIKLCYLYDDLWDENYEKEQPGEFFKKEENIQGLKTVIAQKALACPALKAVRLIAEGMYQAIGDAEWAELRAEERLMDRIQGVATKEQLQKALVWTKGANVSEEAHEETKEYMNQWILGMEEDKVPAFVYSVTGNKALGEGIELAIETFNRKDELPAAHTCTFVLELSAQYVGQEMFNARMNTFLKYAVGFDFS